MNLLAALRSGAFITKSRARFYPVLLLCGFICGLAYLFLTARGLNDFAGRPLGSDFSDIYAAGTLANHGEASAVFNIVRQHSQEQAIFGEATPVYGWHYPPFFLLVAAPLARIPYIPALILWQLSTLALYLWAMAALIRRSQAPEWADAKIWLPPALGFTAVFVNLIHGHNGFLTAALFAGALTRLDERPILAGLLFGLLAYKPQFGVVIPLVLAATGRWQVFGAAAITVAAMALVTTLMFGTQIWPAFLEATHFTRQIVLEQGGTGFYKIQSLFAWVRLMGGSIRLAYAAQALLSLAIAFGLVRIWRRASTQSDQAAALLLSVLLITPYSLDYDLMLLAPAIALLAARGKALGFQPFEACLLVILWLAPFAVRGIAQASHIPLALALMLPAFGLIWRRAES